MAGDFADYLDFYQRGPYAPFVRETRLESGSPIRMLQVAQPAGAFPDPALPQFTVQLVTRGCCGSRVDLGMGPRHARLRPGVLAVAPPDTATDYVIDGPFELIVGVLPVPVVNAALAESQPGFKHFDRLHETVVTDSVVEHVLRRLWREAAEDSPNGRLFAEAAVSMLSLALLSSAGIGRNAASAPPRGLAPWRVKRVLDYMRAHLDQDIGLDELARLADMSSAHFCRAFKVATGLSPIQQLIALRMDLAMTLLAVPGQPIIEVAARCGYESPSRFAKLFRRETGLSPTEWRRTRLI